MDNKTKTSLLNTSAIIGVILAIILIFIGIVSSYRNRAISLEESVKTSLSNISKEEQRRVDLFNNIVDAVKSYNKFEESTLAKITEARAQANSGKIENAQLTIQSVVENYPQLKSQENYKTAQLEFSITENRLASYREQYNNEIKEYNKNIRSFPANLWLGISGYEPQKFEYLDYKVDNSKARNLFDDKR